MPETHVVSEASDRQSNERAFDAHLMVCKACRDKDMQKWIVKLREEGYRFSAIAEKLGKSRQSVHRSYQRYREHHHEGVEWH